MSHSTPAATTHRSRPAPVLTFAATTALALILAACGGDPEPEVDASAGVSLEEAITATVKIEASGSLVDPYEGALEGGWWGSGLIVDPSGLVVTNNHVVVGAATLDVEVDGEQYSARILGSSECLDLAVLDLEGDGFPYFEWYEGDITAALDVWALGFPAVGDTSFTVTKGIVSKPDTANDSEWASIEHTIEHDARIRGGNSGGPLVAQDGSVVGVNYAGNDEDDLNLAIHRDEVLAVFDQLAKGRDVLSLGINGTGYLDESGSGIFVSGVASGSVADEAGVRPGDILTRMEGVTLGTDGTMADYCSILETQGTDATIAVEVFRPSDGGTYVGRFNGAPLEIASLPEVDTGDDTSGGTSDTTGDLVTVTDDSGQVSVEIPSSWGQVDGAQYTDDLGNVVYDVTAAPDLEAFYGQWAASGVSVAASSDALATLTVDGILDNGGPTAVDGGCTLDGGRQPYSDALYTGSYEWWVGCGGVDTTYVLIAATADDGTHIVSVVIQLAVGDEGALEPIVGSFQAAF
ncbi:S1C family serine protease [Actinotalea sp.]|uniref:S1C family serine protease n=1 Tax=Actinotalea sp. TaxID=1872145 RepID=UPI002CA54B66|nr:S1C family serine protease [Actinotalea sp.]HQY33840.1 S1C family serine protease [Actinotalea sp.]HRA49611.1 S1C family serine protease [Actinotalea sp.]